MWHWFFDPAINSVRLSVKYCRTCSTWGHSSKWSLRSLHIIQPISDYNLFYSSKTFCNSIKYIPFFSKYIEKFLAFFVLIVNCIKHYCKCIINHLIIFLSKQYSFNFKKYLHIPFSLFHNFLVLTMRETLCSLSLILFLVLNPAAIPSVSHSSKSRFPDTRTHSLILEGFLWFFAEEVGGGVFNIC